MSEFIKQANSTENSFDWTIWGETETSANFLFYKFRDSVGEYRRERLLDEVGWN